MNISYLILKNVYFKGKDYYIAYASAMNVLGLTAQPGYRTMVVTNRQVQPPIKNIAGTSIQFIYHSKERTDLQKLFYYLSGNRSQAAKKRYLFLSDFLGMEWTSDHQRMLEETGSSCSLLDPVRESTGPVQA